MIYFITDGTYTKIGYTGNEIESRIPALQTGNPNDLTLLFCIDGDVRAEKAIQAHFKEHHYRREWFLIDHTKLDKDFLEDMSISYSIESTMTNLFTKRTFMRGSWFRNIDTKTNKVIRASKKGSSCKIKLTDEQVEKYNSLETTKERLSFMARLRYDGRVGLINNEIYKSIIYLGEQKIFISSREISRACEIEISPVSVKKYISKMKDLIDETNIRNFGVSRWDEYSVLSSKEKVINGVKHCLENGVKLSRRNVANQSGVHFNTVQKMWNNSDVQDVITKRA